MSRDISSSVPDEIAQLIYDGWGDMKSFSVAIGIPYTAVYSVLVKAGHRSIDTVAALAKASPTRISLDDLVNILVIPDVVTRQTLIERLLCGISRAEWARRANLSHTAVNKLLTLENIQLSNFASIANGLGIGIERLQAAYKLIAA